MNADRLDAHLNQSASLPRGLLAHARRLVELNKALGNWLTPQGTGAQQVWLANYRAPRVTLIASSAAVATPLRYRQQEILGWLGEQTGERFTRLEINIRALPGTHKPRV